MADFYRFYLGNTWIGKIYLGSGIVDMPVPSQPSEATRAEVEAYFEDMTEPTLTVSGSGSSLTATLTFTPIPEYIARGMLKSRMVQFRIVRNKANQTTHRRVSPNGANFVYPYHCKNWVKENFPYSFSYDGYINPSNWPHIIHNEGPYTVDVTILNNAQEQQTSVITLSELTSGTLTRSISHLDELKYAGGGNNNCLSMGGAVTKQFYIGFIYFDIDSKPNMYKMQEYHNDTLNNGNFEF